jgi:ornithine carbamoyltransferase
MANSLIVGGLKCGMNVSVATPEGYEPDQVVLDFAKTMNGPKFTLTHNPREAAVKADVLVTDVWASMGMEQEAQKRRRDFAGFQINDEIMELAAPHAMVQHCLPAHRGEEITEKVFEAHADEIFEEAENRLHVQKAVMYLLMGEPE